MRMGVNEPCPPGREITTKIRCEEASASLTALGLAPQKDVQIGDWKDVPYQCSSKVDGPDADGTIHFSTNSDADASRFTTGEFVMICEKGKARLIVI